MDAETSAQAIAEAAMERIQHLLSHAWMVRTFLKHAPEFEDDVELMQIPRTIFDYVRAVETRYGEPEAYLKMARKKISKLQKAADQLASEQPDISDHTNFKQAVISLNTSVREIQELLAKTATR